MAEKSVLARIREFLDSLGSDGDDIDETEAGAVATEVASVEGDTIRADDAPAADAENDPRDGADNEGDPDDSADDSESDDEQTMPDSDAELAQLRDSITVIATENERLRTILTDNGIDFEGDPEIEAAIDADPEVEVDEYDDEAAQADIDAVKARNAEWDK